MKIANVNYPKELEDEQRLELLVSSYKKRCEPAVLRKMSEITLIDFKPKTNNFSTPAFSKQMRLLLSR